MLNPPYRKMTQCPYCDSWLSSGSALYKHIQRKHPGQIPSRNPKISAFGEDFGEDVSTTTTDFVTLICCECGLAKNSFQELETHIHEVHLNWIPYECLFCQRRLPTETSWRDHAAKAHGPGFNCEKVLFFPNSEKMHKLGVLLDRSKSLSSEEHQHRVDDAPQSEDNLGQMPLLQQLLMGSRDVDMNSPLNNGDTPSPKLPISNVSATAIATTSTNRRKRKFKIDDIAMSMQNNLMANSDQSNGNNLNSPDSKEFLNSNGNSGSFFEQFLAMNSMKFERNGTESPEGEQNEDFLGHTQALPPPAENSLGEIKDFDISAEENFDQSLTKDEDRQLKVCFQCGVFFKFKKDPYMPRSHIWSHHMKCKRLKCSECDFSANKVHVVQFHLKKYHPDVPAATFQNQKSSLEQNHDYQAKWECCFPTVIFPRDHFPVIDYVETLDCGLCQEEVPKYNIEAHVRIKHITTPFRCPFCDYEFGPDEGRQTQTSINSHMRTAHTVNAFGIVNKAHSIPHGETDGFILDQFEHLLQTCFPNTQIKKTQFKTSITIPVRNRKKKNADNLAGF